MKQRVYSKRSRRGHRPGGLFRFSHLVTLAALASASCGPVDPTAAVNLTMRDDSTLPAPLPFYDSLGYMIGDRDFPAVGQVLYLPGPQDTAFALLAVSFPNRALRFRREGAGYLARYAVHVTVGDTVAPIASLSSSEEVRVRTFRETSRTDESVVFQGLLRLAGPAVYGARITMRDLASQAGLEARTELHVPDFENSCIGGPILAYAAKPRGSRYDPPSLIVRPRSTVTFASDSALLYVEALCPQDSTATLTAIQEDVSLWTDTLTLHPDLGGDSSRSGASGLRTALPYLHARRLPPGSVHLRVELGGTGTGASLPTVVALLPDWLAAEYRQSIDYLRYAGRPERIEELRSAAPRERAQSLFAFWEEKDSVPKTEVNEFMVEYSRRLREANERFGDGFRAGWLTDRGAVYISFGPPDEVLRDLTALEGTERSQTWLYRHIVDVDLRIVFVDRTGTGVLEMTDPSRRAFREAVQSLY